MQDNQVSQDVTTKAEWTPPHVEIIDFDATLNGGFVVTDSEYGTGS